MDGIIGIEDGGKRGGAYDFARSTSQRRAFRTCGYKFLLKYGHGWAGTARRGTYAFGDAIEQVCHGIVSGFLSGADAAEACFLAYWHAAKEDGGLTYTKRASWELLHIRGRALARLAATELPKRLHAEPFLYVNQRIRYRIGDAAELAIPDQIVSAQRMVGGVWDAVFVASIIDFKTSDRDYDETAADIDEQLTDYNLGGDIFLEARGLEAIRQVGLCVLIYSERPRIQWLMAPARDADERAAFVHGAMQIDRLIRDEVFVRNDRACNAMGRCEYMPLCFKRYRALVPTELRQDTAKLQDELALATELEG